jgi:hypothetical protein
MAAGRALLLLLLSAAALAGVASAAGPFVSDGVFQASAGSTGRSLLQAKKSTFPCVSCSSSIPQRVIDPSQGAWG